MDCPACHTETFVAEIDQNCRVLNVCQNKDCGTKFPSPEEIAPTLAPKVSAPALQSVPSLPAKAPSLVPRVEAKTLESHVAALAARAEEIEAVLRSVEPLRTELAELRLMLAAAKKIPRRRRRRMASVPSQPTTEKVA